MNKIYYNELSEIPTLSKEEQLALVIKVKAGDNKAREKLINANLRLVVHHAKKFEKHILGNDTITVDDLIMEGNFGLMESIDRYEPEHGATLSYFAGVQIKRRMVDFIMANKTTIRIPQRKQLELAKMAKELETVNKSGESTEMHNQYLPSKTDLPENFDFISSLNDNETNFEMWEKIEFALKTLEPRKREIIEYYHQLNGENKNHTQMAEIYEISNTRVGQIYKRAIKILRETVGRISL